MILDFCPAGERAWRTLRRTMHLVEGFCLHAIEIDAAIMGEQICRRLENDGLQVCKLRLTGWTAAARLNALLDDLVAGPGIDDRVVVVIAEGPDAGPDLQSWAHVFSVLNRVRNTLMKACRTDLLLCGPDWFQELGWNAADLWSVRSTTLRFPLPEVLKGLPLDGRPWTGFWDEDWQIVGDGATIAGARLALIEQADALQRYGDQRGALLTRLRATRLRMLDMGGWVVDAELDWVAAQTEEADLQARCWGEQAMMRHDTVRRAGLAEPLTPTTKADAAVIALVKAIDAEADATIFESVIAQLNGWPEMRWWAHFMDASAALESGEIERARQQANWVQAEASTPRQIFEWRKLAFEIDKRAGEWTKALAHAEQRVRAAQTLGQYAHGLALRDLGRMKADRGAVDEALALHREEMEVYEALGDRRERAVALGDIARILKNKGKVDVALTLHREEIEVYEALGDGHSRAVTLGDIARILQNKGAVDEALALHREEMEVYEALGDRHSRALTLGDIARILTNKGAVDEALALHREQIEVYEALGDRHSRAVTLGDIARILTNKGAVDEALALHREEIEVFEALGDRRSRAITLGDIARILTNKGAVDEALALHRERLEVYEALGDRRSRAVTLGDIARIMNSRGRVDEALALHREQIEVYEALGDRHSRAITLGDIARILTNKGAVDEALALHREQIEVYEALGDRHSRAVTLGDIARILKNKGAVDEAVALHREQIEVYEALGDRRARAVTLGDMARILTHKGAVDEALALHREEMEVYEDLGDVASIAWTQCDQGEFALEQSEDALTAAPLFEAALVTFQRIGRVDGIGHAGFYYGLTLIRLDRFIEARAPLEASRDAYALLGWTEDQANIEELLALLPP